MTEIVLNGFRYEIIRPLGTAGAVAQAYLAKAPELNPLSYVVVKTPSGDSPLGLPVALEQLKEEESVLAVLNRAEGYAGPEQRDARARARWAADTVEQRLIVASIDHGVAADGQYYAVQEMAPPEVEPVPPSDLASELRALRLAHCLARAVSIAHKCDIALRDFVPQSKIDRLRAEWNGDRLVSFKIIDWNISGGRAQIPNDLVFLGSMIFALLTGRFPPLIKQDADTFDLPPFEPEGLAGPTWGHLSEGSRLLLRRLVNRLPTRRPSSAEAVASEIRWLEGLLAQRETPPARWVEMASDCRDRPDRVLALVAAARTGPLPDHVRLQLEQAEQSARRTLEAADERFIRSVRKALNDWVFSEAISSLDYMLDGTRLDPDGEAARKAHYLRQQAEFGRTLRDQHLDVRQSEEYRHVATAVDRLIDRKWAEASQELGWLPPVTLHRQPAARALHAVADWRLASDRIRDAVTAENTRPDDPALPDKSYEQKEQARCGALLELQRQLEGWRADAPFEADLAAQAYALGKQIELRQRFIAELPLIREKMRVGDEASAAERCRQFLRDLPDHSLARATAREADVSLAMRKQVPALVREMHAGAYERASQVGGQLVGNRPAEMPEVMWRRICEQVGLVELLDEARASQQAVDQTGRDLEKTLHALELLAGRMANLPGAEDPEITPEELEIAQQAADLQSEMARWRLSHEQGQPVLPFDLLTDIGKGEQEARRLLEGLVARRLGDVETSLDRFDRNTAVRVEALVRQLQAWGPAASQAQRIEEGRKRLARLQELLADTDRSLSADIQAAVNSFVRVGNSPDVASETRAQVNSLVGVWVERNNRSSPLPQMHANQSEPWPGYRILSERIATQLFTEVSRDASDRYSRGQWEEASRLYELIERMRYGCLDSAQRSQLAEALVRGSALREISESLGTLGDDVEFDRAWGRLKELPGGEPVQTVRDALLSGWENHIWSTLPEEPEPQELDRLASRFEEAYKKTYLDSWHAQAEFCRRAALLLQRRAVWQDRAQWQARARSDQALLEELRTHPKLGMLGRRWHVEWRQAFATHWEAATALANRCFEEEKAEEALEAANAAKDLLESLCPSSVEGGATVTPTSAWRAGCLQKSGIELGAEALSGFEALHTRVQALCDRNHAFQGVVTALSGSGAAITDEQAKGLREACRAASECDLPSQAAAVQLADYIEAAQRKQRALQTQESDKAFASWIDSLSCARQPPVPQDPKEGDGKDAAWEQWLTEWHGRLGELDASIDDLLARVYAELLKRTANSVGRLVTQINTGTADESSVASTAQLIWQLAWRTAPEVNHDRDGSVARALGELVSVVTDAIEGARNKSIRSCSSEATHEIAQKRFHHLERVLNALVSRPSELELPIVGAAWRPAVLDNLRVTDLAWRDLYDIWASIGRPLDFQTPESAEPLLSERIGLIDRVLSATQIRSGELVGSAVALERAGQIASIRSKINQCLKQKDLLGAHESASQLPHPPGPEGDWQLAAKPDWLKAPLDNAEQAIQAQLEPLAEECLRQPADIAKALMEAEVLPLVQQGINREIVRRALEEAAANVAHGYEHRNEPVKAASVWRVIRSVPPSQFPGLKAKADKQISRIEGTSGVRKRLVRAIIVVSIVAMAATAVVYYVLHSQIVKTQREVSATQTASAATATWDAMSESDQATASAANATVTEHARQTESAIAAAATRRANQTATAEAATATWQANQAATETAATATRAAQLTAIAEGFRRCGRIEFDILAEPNLAKPIVSSRPPTVPLTWKVKNKAVAADPNCDWGPKGQETELLGAVEIVGDQQSAPIKVRLKWMAEGEYELTLENVGLALGESSRTWQLLVPEKFFAFDFVPDGPKLTVTVIVVTPTPTPTRTPTRTPTPTSTPTPTRTPCPTACVPCNCHQVCTIDPRQGEICEPVCDDECCEEQCP